MLKKIYFRQKQLLLKPIYKKNELKTKILKSLFRNHFQHYLYRLTYSKFLYTTDTNKFFKSHQKLYCFINLNKKVPSKNYMLSRFSLNKKIDTLSFYNLFKNLTSLI